MKYLFALLALPLFAVACRVPADVARVDNDAGIADEEKSPAYCPRRGQAAIVYTMDDGAPGQAEALARYSNGNPRFTVFPFDQPNSYLVTANALRFGHEIGVHGDGRVSAADDFRRNFAFARDQGARAPYLFALPYGRTEYVQLLRGFAGARGTRCVPAVTGAFERFNTPGCSITHTTTPAQAAQWVASAKQQGGIVITYMHQMTPSVLNVVNSLAALDGRDGQVSMLTFRQALNCGR